MITNETRARLVSRPRYWGARFDGPFYDTDANAVAELRKFVRARGGKAMLEFALQVRIQLSYPASDFSLLDATPAQQTAAFDAVFKDELERINEA